MGTDRPIWRSRAWLVAATVLIVVALTLLGAGTAGGTPGLVRWVPLAVAFAATVSILGWARARTRDERKRYDDNLAAWAAERATQIERLRIAADLHDLVSHGLGLITVRAAAARGMTGPAGETERLDALADIERVSRDTTTELRRMLNVLRAPGAAPLRPADTFDDLPTIVAAAEEDGLAVTFDGHELGDASPGVQLAVCAVVREALANVIRHAGPTEVRIGVYRDDVSVTVDVWDAGPGDGWRPQPGSGHGLDGLRERVTALGGTLYAGPDGNGFHLTASIPDRER